MKTQIIIEKEALQYLNDAILSPAGVKSRAEARKLDLAFKTIRPILTGYQKDVNTLRMKYRVEKKDADGKVLMDHMGNIQYMFPDEIVPDVEKEMLHLATQPIEVEFETESFVFVKTLVEGVYDRPEFKEKGLVGETQMKMMTAIEDAFDAANKID